MDLFTPKFGITLTAKLLSSLASTSGSMLAKQLLAPVGPGAGLVERPVLRPGLVPWRRSNNLATNDIKKLVSKLYRRAAKTDLKVAELDHNQRDMAIEAATKTLLVMNDPSMDLVQSQYLDPERLAEYLRLAAANSTSDIDGLVRAVYDLLLDTACIHIVEYFSRRWDFTARTQVEQTKTLGELERRIPDPAERAVAFESRLRSGLSQELDRMFLFGLLLSDIEQSYQLTTAYVSLSVETAEVRGVGRRVEDMLASDRRILLEGAAGAGKTTLLRRLAMYALRDELPKRFSHLRGNFPFLLQLCTFVEGDHINLPGPDQFLKVVAPMVGNEPDEWTVNRLSKGVALILIDGVDEVAAEHRPAVLSWIERLVAYYPNAYYMVTSRPAAVSDRWRNKLKAIGFSSARVEPLTPDRVNDLIVRWHQAVAKTPEEADNLDDCVNVLRDAIACRRDLARLATNPLLCAMLCALNRSANNSLPDGRIALYEGALTMLLDRREKEQKIHTSPISLDKQQIQPFLSKMAVWMTLNSRRTIPRADAISVIDELLPRLRVGSAAQVEISSELLLCHLVERSGLLHEPTIGLLEFIHPSFMDYLCATEIFRRNYLEHLLNNAHDSLYHDVAIMAVGQTQGDPNKQSELLNGIIKRAEEGGEHSRKLWLLGAACIADVGMIDPEIVDRIKLETERLLPPNGWTEAETVADAGEFVLDLLAEAAQRRTFSNDEAACTVRIAGLAAADEPVSIGLMCQFRSRNDPRVQAALVAAWARSADPDKFVDQVLVDAAMQDALIHLPSIRLLSMLNRLTNLRQLAMPRDTSDEDIEQLARILPLRINLIDLTSAPTVNISPLRKFRDLTIRIAAEKR